MRKVVSLIVLLFTIATYSQARQSGAEKSAYGILNRILPERASSFVFKEITASKDKDVFEVSNGHAGKIVISGNSAVAMASGLDWYLKNYCNAHISLNYNQLDLPKTLPRLTSKIRKETPFDYRYLFNYCTYGYTMPWWNWDRWEEMIDYMALKGVNMPLAIIGQEAVWQEVLSDFGMSQQQIDDFFVGPAHLPWGWMGNIDGMGGPLPQNWITQRKELQVKILNRMRSLGMKPVLQAFTGHVPQVLKKLYPEANIFQIEDWAGVEGTYFLDPTDELFQKIGTAFIKKQTELYGTDHLYDADCFIEVDPPSKDPAFLKQVSESVYKSMELADSKATWVLQGWFFFFKKDFWTKERGRAFLDGIPKNRAIVLDLYGEKNPTWDKTDAFYGQPWIWNVICNEDQKVNMSGDLEEMQRQFQEAYTSEIGNNLKGIGVIPEGLGYNPIVQDFIFEKAWDPQKVNVQEWIEDYATIRYGTKSPSVKKAWQLLGESVYGRTRTMWSPLITTPRLMIFEEGSKEDIRHVRKDFKITETDPFAWDFDVYKLAKAAGLLLGEANELQDVETYNFDLTNVYRELLFSLTHKSINDVSVAYQEKDRQALDRSAKSLFKLMDDLEAITGTNENFLLGKWLEDAKSWGSTPEEKEYYEWNARTIVTIWQPYPEGGLRDYAGKQWNGLFSGYYKPRWQLFVDHLRRSLTEGVDFDPKAYDAEVREMDYKWTRSHQIYPSAPTEKTIDVARRIQTEYAHLFKK
ncbi:alpha-N-acetylglucosaminidase [Zobellia galactanivorans]|uniref:alpha-N-acetylglucosaminidase n=1 Tax=Zobellia galactanivorans (strain DSM 12802 / CCUG 47099 / CIP 106680 / NCIMB 13871 / Dsij) TaxID=63186 RepID=UPI001C07C0E2|nr:alpha-N-acetylglucosaminidase [Zobellia galactanivorans]MBU3025273.1 alpha-N-acetylglucosaminidase [Zobellia galactanivorans]